MTSLPGAILNRIKRNPLNVYSDKPTYLDKQVLSCPSVSKHKFRPEDLLWTNPFIVTFLLLTLGRDSVRHHPRDVSVSNRLFAVNNLKQILFYSRLPSNFLI